MKTIKLKNSEIVPVYNALENIVVQGRKPRRGKGKLQKTLSQKNKEYLEDLEEIRADFFKKKEDGTFEIEGDRFVWLDEIENSPESKKQANEQIKELNNEEVGIGLVEHESKIKSFFDALEKDEFTGKDELRDEDFETLMELLEDAFENNEDKKEEEK